MIIIGRPEKIYNAGDKIGTYQLTIVEEVEPHITAGGTKHRQFKVVCPSCGEYFVARMNNLNRKMGGHRAPIQQCPDCSLKENNERIANVGRNSIKDLTGQRFGKLTVLYMTDKRSNKSVIWHCKCDCGNEIDVKSNDLQRKHTLSCGCLKSKGEQLISLLLRENNITFEQQKTFNNCMNPENTNLLFFDFYLPDYNCCIEYDGEQHFMSVDHFGGEEHFKRRQLLDFIKNEYCENNGIKMVRIPYTNFDLLDENYILELIK